MMNKILRQILDHGVVIYQDDIMIYSKNMEDQIKEVQQVLDGLKQGDSSLVKNVGIAPGRS